MTGPRRAAKPPPLPPSRKKRPREPVDVPRFDPAQPLLDLEENSTTKTYDRFEVDLPMPDLQLPPREREGLGPIPMGDGFPEGRTQVAGIPTGGTSASPHKPAPPRRSRSPLTRYVALGAVAAAAWGGVVAASQLGEHEAPQPPKAPSVAAASAAQPTEDAAAAPTPPPNEQPSDERPADERTADKPAEDTAQDAPGTPPTEPRVAWTFEAAAAPLNIAAAPGAIVARWPERIAGIVEGAEAWATQGAVDSLDALPSGAVLVTADGKARALAASDGSTSFEVELPKARRAKKPPQVVATAVKDSNALLAFADARFVRVASADCTADAGACLEDVGRLRGEYLEPSAHVAVGGEGMRFLVEDESLRAFDVGFKESFSVEADHPLLNVSPVDGGRLVLGFSGEVALLDTARCSGRATVRLSKQTTAPSGCVLWRFNGQLDVSGATPIDAETIAVNGRGRLQAIAEGEDSWKSPLSSLGPVLHDTASGQLLTLIAEPADGQTALSLVAVDPTKGTVSWTLPLGLAFDEPPGADQIALRLQPGWVGVAANAQLALVELPPAT